MEDKATTLEELISQHQELQFTCQIWMAANDAKDERIAQLEQENARLRKKVARLGGAPSPQQNTLPRVVRLGRR